MRITQFLLVFKYLLIFQVSQFSRSQQLFFQFPHHIQLLVELYLEEQQQVLREMRHLNFHQNLNKLHHNRDTMQAARNGL